MDRRDVRSLRRGTRGEQPSLASSSSQLGTPRPTAFAPPSFADPGDEGDAFGPHTDSACAEAGSTDPLADNDSPAFMDPSNPTRHEVEEEEDDDEPQDVTLSFSLGSTPANGQSTPVSPLQSSPCRSRPIDQNSVPPPPRIPTRNPSRLRSASASMNVADLAANSRLLEPRRSEPPQTRVQRASCTEPSNSSGESPVTREVTGTSKIFRQPPSVSLISSTLAAASNLDERQRLSLFEEAGRKAYRLQTLHGRPRGLSSDYSAALPSSLPVIMSGQHLSGRGDPLSRFTVPNIVRQHHVCRDGMSDYYTAAASPPMLPIQMPGQYPWQPSGSLTPVAAPFRRRPRRSLATWLSLFILGPLTCSSLILSPLGGRLFLMYNTFDCPPPKPCTTFPGTLPGLPMCGLPHGTCLSERRSIYLLLMIALSTEMALSGLLMLIGQKVADRILVPLLLLCRAAGVGILAQGRVGLDIKSCAAIVLFAAGGEPAAVRFIWWAKNRGTPMRAAVATWTATQYLTAAVLFLSAYSPLADCIYSQTALIVSVLLFLVGASLFAFVLKPPSNRVMTSPFIPMHPPRRPASPTGSSSRFFGRMTSSLISYAEQSNAWTISHMPELWPLTLLTGVTMLYLVWTLSQVDSMEAGPLMLGAATLAAMVAVVAQAISARTNLLLLAALLTMTQTFNIALPQERVVRLVGAALILSLGPLALKSSVMTFFGKGSAGCYGIISLYMAVVAAGAWPLFSLYEHRVPAAVWEMDAIFLLVALLSLPSILILLESQKRRRGASALAPLQNDMQGSCDLPI